jgi:DNA polymerase-3 subunit gamma/tau
MPTLYRSYRPQTFAEVMGQPHITQTLQKAIQNGRLSHAYLFYGPRGTGKTTTARLLAKRVNCLKATEQDAEPCTTCELCVAAQAGTNIDIVEIDAASNRGIDDIRALREAATSRPTRGNYKVYIVDEVHMLTGEAFAALLKVLEEPQAHIIFILATTELHKVPATIASRCQIYRFRRATPAELRERLQYILKQEKRTADDSALEFIISRADGCYRDAESLLGQLLTAQKKLTRDSIVEFLGLPPLDLVADFLSGLIRSESAPALAALERSLAEGFDPEHFLKESIIVARNAAVSLVKQEATVPEFARHPAALARLPQIIRALLQALQDLAFVPQPQIALQLAVLAVCTTKGGVRSVPAPAARVSPAPAPDSPSETPVAKAPLVSVETVRQSWPQIIHAMKAVNPVASTFLRAIEPKLVDGATLTVQAHYALHRNFFDKPQNKETLLTVVKTTLNVPLLAIRCELDAAEAATWKAAKGQAETDLYEAAKAMFGQSAPR